MTGNMLTYNPHKTVACGDKQNSFDVKINFHVENPCKLEMNIFVNQTLSLTQH